MAFVVRKTKVNIEDVVDAMNQQSEHLITYDMVTPLNPYSPSTPVFAAHVDFATIVCRVIENGIFEVKTLTW